MTFWVIKHYNAMQYMTRTYGYWGRTWEIDAAERYPSRGAADGACQALRAEAHDRVKASKESWPDQMWWDIYGGAVGVVEAESFAREVDRRLQTPQSVCDTETSK